MALIDDIQNLLNEFGIKLAEDYNDAFNEALKKGGSKNPQEAALNFTPQLKLEANSLTIQVVASDKYWRYVETGRKKGSQPPSKAFGKKWLNKNNINPSNVVFALSVEYNKKNKLSRKVKKLPFAKAANQLAFIIARSIKKKGIKPKPFKDKVDQDGRLEELQKKISELIGQNIILNFNT